MTFTEDTVYSRPDLELLTLENTIIVCKKDNGFACSLTFRIGNATENTGLTLTNSTIEAKGIFIDNPGMLMQIDSNSRISADGRSDGYTGYYKNQGASYVGQGGYCPLDGKVHVEKHYAEFDIMPNFANIHDMKGGKLTGSMGEYNPLDVRTAGGGHIFLNIDALYLYGEVSKGHISANGLPEAGTDDQVTIDLNGGSGGYVYINTQNKYNTNTIESEASITVIGGHGTGNGFGGSGGIVTFGKDVKEEEFMFISKTRGGTGGKVKRDNDQTLCANGAAGTAFFDKNDWLFVWNGDVLTSKHTFLTAKKRNPNKFPNKYMAADNLVVWTGANLNIICNSLDRIVFDSVLMITNSTMTL